MNEKCAQRHWKRQWLGRQWLAKAHGFWNTKGGGKGQKQIPLIVTATLSGFKRRNKLLQKLKFRSKQDKITFLVGGSPVLPVDYGGCRDGHQDTVCQGSSFPEQTSGTFPGRVTSPKTDSHSFHPLEACIRERCWLANSLTHLHESSFVHTKCLFVQIKIVQKHYCKCIYSRINTKADCRIET